MGEVRCDDGGDHGVVHLVLGVPGAHETLGFHVLTVIFARALLFDEEFQEWVLQLAIVDPAPKDFVERASDVGQQPLSKGGNNRVSVGS